MVRSGLSDDYPNGQRSVASEIIIRILAAIGFPGSRPMNAWSLRPIGRIPIFFLLRRYGCRFQGFPDRNFLPLVSKRSGSASVIDNSTVQGGEEGIGPKSNRKAFRASLVRVGMPSIESLLIG